MGRFFQARPIELSQNNIYQPSLELMMAANEYGNNEIKETAEQRQSILDDLQIRYREDLDTNNVNTYKKEIEDKVNNITELLKKDPQSKEAKSMLYQVSRDMNKDFGKNGKIYNIQKTYDNDIAYKEKLDGIKDMSEMDKQRNYEGHLNKFKQLNPDGSINTHYDPQEVYENVNYIPDLIKARQSITPEVHKQISDKLNGLYRTTTSTEYKNNYEKEFHRMYLEANPTIKTALERRTSSGFYNDLGFTNNADGTLNYDSIGAKNASNYVDLFNTQDTSKSVTNEGDAVALAIWQRSNELNAERTKKAEELGGLQLETNARTTEQLDSINIEFGKELNVFMSKELGLKPYYNPKTKRNEYSVEQGQRHIQKSLDIIQKPQQFLFGQQPTNNFNVTTAQKIKALNSQMEKLNAIKSMHTKKSSNVSWVGAAAIVGVGPATQIKKDYETRYGTDPESMYSIKMNEFKINGKTFNNKSLNDIINNPVDYGLDPSVFYEKFDDVRFKPGSSTNVLFNELKEQYNANSAIPAVYSATDMSINDMLFDFNRGGNSIQAKADFKKMGLSIQY